MIAIGISTNGVIKSRTACSLMELMKLPYDFFPIFSYGNNISDNRERIVKIAQENNCEHLLFVDGDMRFDPQVVKTLLEKDKDIIGANYHYRFSPPRSVVKPFPNATSEGLQKVAAAGTGFLLIKMSVFEKVERPYFLMEFNQGLLSCGEDVYFCEKARKAGFDVWVDFSLEVKHIGDYEY